MLGGPGSGKSVLALSLLGNLSRRGRRVMHATGSKAFTETMRKVVVGARNARAQSLFTFFNGFIGAEPNTLDMLICDEAHRIRETSTNRFTRAEVRAVAKRQVQELIAVARTPVFLLDEHQVVRPGEMGTEREIRTEAEKAGCRVEVVRLEDQFRCGGSQLYEQWVLRLLGLDPRAPVAWSELTRESDETYRVAALPTPTALESWLVGQNPGNADTARITAGYCWRWSDPEVADGTKRLVDDVVIGEWRRPWNAKPEKAVPDVPPSHFWASDARGFGQVGCIYTAQGFEYDWSGVIFGDDFVRRDGRLGLPPRVLLRLTGQTGEDGVPRPCAQHLQGAADPRDEGDRRVLDRPGDAGVPRTDVPVSRLGAVQSDTSQARAPGTDPIVSRRHRN